MARSPKQEDTQAHLLSKVYPRLRMIANGDDTVNRIRSEINATVAYQGQDSLQDDAARALGLQLPLQSVTGDIPEPVIVKPEKPFSAKEKRIALAKGKYKDDPAVNAFVHVFIELRSDVTWETVYKEILNEHPEVGAQISDVRIQGSLVQLRTSLDAVRLLTDSTYVYQIENSQSLLVPPSVRYYLSTESQPARRNNQHVSQSDGSQVIIGIIDVGGFDFAHPDFLTEDGQSRFMCIWDQGGQNRKSPAKTFEADKDPIEEFRELTYGSVILGEHMNRAILNAPSIGVPVHRLEPQSQQHPSSHGTHVASIAAGNSGVCPNSDIAAVIIELAEGDNESKNTFTDSSRITDAVDFLLALSQREKKPISINISLGTNGHAHDGSSAVNRWIDAKLATEGRCLCVATGNAGQEKGLTDDDFGYIMGRIHSSGCIKSTGLMTDLEWHVIGDGNVDVSENELEIWYGPQDRMSVMIRPPGGDWIGPVAPQKIVENLQLPDKTFISVYNTLYNRSNGANHIAIYLSPNLNPTQVVGVRSGLWKIRLIGEEIRDGQFDAWIERDDPIRRSQVFWNFPSFFSETTNVDEKSINSLACGHNVIAVGNFDEEKDDINITSSQGPTRDNRQKPEIVAPGTNVVAANGFAGKNSLWTSMTGTSMASPYVCGVAGLLLSEYPHLTSQQISGIIIRTITPIVGNDYNWKNNTGYGLINLRECLEEAKSVVAKEDITNSIKKQL